MEIKHSKYFFKHYYEAELTDIQCRTCGKWFAIDLVACETEPDKLTPRYWAVCRCPYCGQKKRIFI